MSRIGSPSTSRRLIASRCWCGVSFGLRPIWARVLRNACYMTRATPGRTTWLGRAMFDGSISASGRSLASSVFFKINHVPLVSNGHRFGEVPVKGSIELTPIPRTSPNANHLPDLLSQGREADMLFQKLIEVYRRPPLA